MKGFMKMNEIDAINMRQSRRSYQSTPIAPDKRLKLRAIIEEYNQESGLSIQLIEQGKEAFQGLNVSYGMFSGVQSFFAMVGKKSDPNLKEKIGYYGELLVLESTKLELGTCWIGATYNHKKCPCVLDEDESLVLIITVGNVNQKKSFKENIIYKVTHRRTKTIEQLTLTDSPLPEWFIEGMEAVKKAPSAMNLQPVLFQFKNGVVTAKVSNTENHQLIDLGIAKAHFELGACGKFEFGNNAPFKKQL